ncbi:efflux RND transporter permease subunit [Gallaecimonas sp. GXIMD4217]|uniref:efflux RND transporter permease subunit n=1 Tax=Gallaecimonas sp. GXIMD4217 TaxID=3131927 RepID=UPI00311B275F
MTEQANLASRMAAVALRRPVTILMLSLSLLVMGLVSSRVLPLEMWPGIEIPQIDINVPYANATPAEVEDAITRPIEEALATLSGIKEMRSRSASDGAHITLQFDWSSNINAKSIEAREKLDSIRHLLPDDVERVFVYQFSTADMPVLTLRLSSQGDLSHAYDVLERELKRPLERIAGVSRVTLYGVEKPEVQVALDPARLRAMGLAPRQVVEMLTKANFQVAGGYIQNEQRRYLIQPQGNWADMAAIENTYLSPSIQLKDVATVILAKPELREGRHFDRTYAVGLDVFKESSANLVAVAEAVMAVVHEAESNPALDGIRLFVMEDQAQSVKDSLSGLTQAGLVGAALSALVLLLFLRNLSMTAVVVLSVPFSLCLTLAAMYFLDISLNILSLMGLMLAVGMLVDNAVVVVESIATERSRGLSGSQAVVKGVGRVALAMAAGTLTTAIVFLPNFFGAKIDVTVFLKHVSVAICLSLAASLLLAITLIPLLARRLAPAQAKIRDHVHYKGLLAWVLDRPKRMLAFFVVLAASTALPLSQLPSDDQFDGDGDRLFINMEAPGEFPVAMMEAEVDRMEEFLYANKDELGIRAVYSYYEPRYATSTLLLDPDTPLSRDELRKRLREGWPKMALVKTQLGWKNGGDSEVQITLQGPSTNRLLGLAEDLVPQLARIQGLVEVRADADQLAREIRIKPDPVRTNRLGLSARDIAEQVSLALRGSPARTLRDDNGETRVQLYVEKDARYDKAMLARLPVAQVDGRLIRLEQVAELVEAPQVGSIMRFDRQTTLYIAANLEELTLSQAREAIEQMMSNISLPAGYTWSLDGRFRRQNEGQQAMMVNMVLALALIYLVMAALFESVLMPVAILTAILFSMTGAFWAFWFTGTPMGIMGMIGLLILMGIVVNNGIVLVDRINQLRGSDELKRVIVTAAAERLRPILMTVATTVLGLVPLALGDTRVGGGGPNYAPMAIAIIGGLILSTLVSLVLVPLCYLMLDGLRARWNRVKTAALTRAGWQPG